MSGWIYISCNSIHHQFMNRVWEFSVTENKVGEEVEMQITKIIVWSAILTLVGLGSIKFIFQAFSEILK